MASSNTPPEKSSSYLDTPLGSQRQQGDISAHGSGYFPPENTQSEYPPGYEDPGMTPGDVDYTRQPYPSQYSPPSQGPGQGLGQGQGQWSAYPLPSQAPYPPQSSQGPYPPPSQGPYPPLPQGPYSPSFQPPQQQHQFQQQQQGTPPVQNIRLKLINPRQLSSGFSELAPQTLRQLAPSATEATWSQFISEINEQLHHAPGALAKGVTNFWLVNLVTLGLSSHAREMYRSRVESKAAVIVERYNATVFGGWGIRVGFDVVPLRAPQSGPSSHAEYDRRRRRDERDERDEPDEALELVISRA